MRSKSRAYSGIGKRKRSWGRQGALEGLPLYIIILVVIAAVAMVALLSFFNTGTKDLGSIQANTRSDFKGDAIINDNQKSFYVKALDNNGDPLKGVSVTASGPNGAIGSGTTDSKGVTYITLSTTPTLPDNVDFGEIAVTAKYTGSIEVTKTTTVVVQNT